jgi:membrane protease YdiL (CAAX protease family)
MAATAVVLSMVDSTPYSNASAVVETVVVPVTEELVFRAVLLTALLALFSRLTTAHRAALLAVVVNGLTFGVAHLANAQALAASFVIGQAVFASVLGIACATLMANTRSVYPAMLLHAAVNAVVVLV